MRWNDDVFAAYPAIIELMQDYHKLLVWQRAHVHGMKVRRTAFAHFPRRGFADLRSQVVKAAESIPETIVEGAGAATRPEFARFLDMAIKSASETEYELRLARDYRILPPALWRRLTAETVEIRKMLFGLRRSVREADAEERERAKRLKRRRGPR